MFWFPPKPQRIYNSDIIPKNYKFQIKKNGVRIEIVIDNKGKILLYNRHGVLLRIPTGNWSWIVDIFGANWILDGELIGYRQVGDSSDTITIWDCPFAGKIGNMTEENYDDRYEILKNLPTENFKINKKGFGTTPISKNDKQHLYLSKNYEMTEVKKVMKILDNVYDEGIVAKNGKNNLSWNTKRTIINVNQLKIKK